MEDRKLENFIPTDYIISYIDMQVIMNTRGLYIIYTLLRDGLVANVQ